MPSPQVDSKSQIYLQGEDQSRLLHAALNSIEDFTYVFNREGRFIYCNRALLSLLGITLEEIIGRNFFDLNYPSELAARLQRQIQEVFSTGNVVIDETPYTSEIGKSGIYEYIFTPVLAADKSIEFVAGTTRDISTRKLAEQDRESLLQQLEAERAKLHYLFAKAPAFVTTLRGPEHIFELTNPMYLQLTGHRNLVGKSVREALPEIEGQGYFELLDRVYQTGEPFTGKGLEVDLQRTPNAPLEKRFIDLVYQPIFDNSGQVTGIFAHGVDITEQVEARREAERANLAKDEFLATLSHELRSPLSAIMGWTGILQSDQITAEERELGLSTIARNARAQSQLIEDILDVSRMVAGKMNLKLEPVEFHGIIEEALSTIIPAAQAKDVRVNHNFDGGVNVVSGDQVRLQQVVGNLLSNALKFTPKGGHIQVNLQRIGSQIELVVSDSGIGIAPEVLPRVFDRFRQADSSSTRAQDGLGLGLAIVHHLVELHGGSVVAMSEGVGQGATFIVQLPLTSGDQSNDGTEENPDRATGAARRDTPRLDSLNILVVDDQEDTRKILTVLLERYGARVSAVTSAAEAMAAIQQLKPDILLSDIGMPGEDGHSLIKRIRALTPEEGGQIPAAALTAFARQEDRTAVLESGFQAYLSKPVDPLELIDLVISLTTSKQ